jgi:predicted glutamine amidotransferase
MCRLLGITNFEYGTHRAVVEAFCGLAGGGAVMAGDPPGHADGWGMAYYRDGRLAVCKSGLSLLEEADRVHDALSRVGSSPVVILHLRKSAWKDTSSTRHAHPFQIDNVAFAHNGVLHDYRQLLPEITVPGLGDDALDTEVWFYGFMSARSRGLGQAFLDTLSRIKAEGYRFSALNCLFSDGRRLFAYRDYSKEPDYYSLYKALAGSSCVICSEPLVPDLQWEMMGKGEFLEIPAAQEG